MTRQEFLDLTKSIIYLDGATGSNLVKAGMPAGVCPEKWILDHPDTFLELQKSYVDAGTDILYAPTFTANRVKLAEYGLENELDTMIRSLVSLSKQAAMTANDRTVYVAGDITMTGKQLVPIGTLTFEELCHIYKEQIQSLCKAGVDLLVIETMMSLAETRAALIAAKEVCDLPVMVTMTFEREGRTLYGTEAKTAAIVLESMGADAIGVNCSAGPAQMAKMIREIALHTKRIPIIAKPNAGLPFLDENGQTCYDLSADGFASEMEELVNAGATILGGCCGTTPEHIACITNKFGREITSHVDRSPKGMHYLTSERKTLAFGLEDPLLIVGERINPTGKKALQQELKENTYDLLLEYAEDQEDAGAALLDVNVGMNGIDEKEVMLQALDELSLTTSLPLSLDSSRIEVMEAALRHYHGRALINSISLEKDKISQWLPIAKKYGAMFILLPLSDQGLPKSYEEKIAMIETILQEAKRLGFEKEDIVVDGLVTTIATNKQAAVDTLRAIRYCKENGLATIVGLSNISYGMPARSQLNSAFLNLAIKDGLTMAIANPCQDLYVSCDLAKEVLLGKENADLLFIEKNAGLVKHNEANKSSDVKQALYQAVMKGNKNAATAQTLQLLSAGADPVEILNKTLMPAMDEVGKLFATGKYFLPQLIHSAEAMETAIKQIEPLLAVSDDTESRQTIILASVEGDIHDIGKNLVGLMLKNHGYHIVDLGKDVPAETIVNAAIEQDAQIIGLSALMTTTMQRMREVVNLVKEKQLKTKVIVGGAVITKEYADEIHADGYSKDAQEAVLLVKELLA